MVLMLATDTVPSTTTERICASVLIAAEAAIRLAAVSVMSTCTVIVVAAVSSASSCAAVATFTRSVTTVAPVELSSTVRLAPSTLAALSTIA